jgi:transposase
MKKSPKYSVEVRERAVRMVLEHQGEHSSQWSAIQSIAGKVGCSVTSPVKRTVRNSNFPHLNSRPDH